MQPHNLQMWNTAVLCMWHRLHARTEAMQVSQETFSRPELTVNCCTLGLHESTGQHLSELNGHGRIEQTSFVQEWREQDCLGCGIGVNTM